MNLINLGTQELIDLHTPEAKAELERRVSKNGRKNAVKALQNWDGEGVGATIAVNGVMEAPQAGTREEAIKALLKELGVELPEAVQVPAPVKPKRENTERIGGVNIQRTVDDNGWTYEIVGVWDGDKVSLDHELAGYKTTGATDAEAKEAFYAPFKEKNVYLSRPYRHPLIDNRTGNALKQAVETIAKQDSKPADLTRDELKAKLGLPSNSRMSTKRMQAEVAKKEEGNTVEAKPSAASIADLMAKFSSLNG
tara:strand:+ start:27 stop:782 length:756 start_codon:yes stop_codon:yes gene_type:complete